MENANELKTIQIRAGKRTYFIDVNTASNGNKYLKINESLYESEGKYKRNGIMVFENHIKEFIDAIISSVKQFPNPKKEINEVPF
ncbi:MAG: DUF3276 family protein [Chlorobiota bacterium]|nr:DUF3276 family protein [Chlorobiota bacterium]QQS65701.1 MAG: DUF3276 family protein [Chlorobiota bacterium]